MANYVSGYSGAELEAVLSLFVGKGLGSITGLIKRNADGSFGVGSAGSGTVTSIGITAGNGISVSGSPITSSGNITVGHSNSVTAQTTQALYPIKIDAQGHISGYGAAVTSMPASDVSAWAKASTKPTYTAAEVGAVPLGTDGVIDSSYLPSYVDDVLEYSTKSKFPSTGETGKIYVDTTTNLTYRWSGSTYVEISPSIALGTTSSTAYRGDYGNAAYAHAVTNKGAAFTNGLYKITTNAEGHVTAATAVIKTDITALGIPAQDTVYTHPSYTTATTAAVKVGRDATGHVVLGNVLTYTDVNATKSVDTTVSLTTSGWSSNTQTVTLSGVTTSNTVVVAPTPASKSSYTSAGVICTGQAANKLTFTCDSTPTTALTVNVLIMDR